MGRHGVSPTRWTSVAQPVPNKTNCRFAIGIRLVFFFSTTKKHVRGSNFSSSIPRSNRRPSAEIPRLPRFFLRRLPPTTPPAVGQSHPTVSFLLAFIASPRSIERLPSPASTSEGEADVHVAPASDHAAARSTIGRLDRSTINRPSQAITTSPLSGFTTTPQSLAFCRQPPLPSPLLPYVDNPAAIKSAVGLHLRPSE